MSSEEIPPPTAVSVAVPVAVPQAFSYRVVAGARVPAPGSRVLVPFGSRVLVGIVRPVAAEVTPRELKSLVDDLDAQGQPALPEDVVGLCEWLADYYFAPVGEAYRLALPGLLTNADARTVVLSETGQRRVEADDTPLLRPQDSTLDGGDLALLRALLGAGGSMSAAKLAGFKPKIPGALRRLGPLEAAGLISLQWGEAESKVRRVTNYRRTDLLRGAAADEGAVRKVVGRSKQRRALLDDLETRPADAWTPITELRGRFPRVRDLIKPLVDAGLVVRRERLRELDPFTGEVDPADSNPRAPTDDQRMALERLIADLDSKRGFQCHLLHGVTGSGKTEVYLQLIAKAREEGGGAIVLVPEIALTPQLANRFRARFGEAVAVLHSGLTPKQRLDAWEHIRLGRRPIVIGARSAIFAPVANLRVIVVDEEHDGSFKQEEGVRYHARDVAVVRGRSVGALVVLGSATPSLETYENARKGRYQWLKLQERPTPRPLPTVEVLSLSVHRPDPETMLTAKLKQAIIDTTAAGEQTILFLNRRGYTTTMSCLSCGALQQCPDCSAPSMTYHLGRNRLVCHLCGHIEDAPRACLACKSDNLVHGQAGTERVEVALAGALPGVRVLRLDRDTSRGVRLLEVLGQFRAHQADVLVGTQMLSKGHDFPGVTLVGILQGDHGLGMPDLRAAERTFQLLTQVAGRAGRGARPGKVIIQAWATDHPSVQRASHHDYEGFAEEELARRLPLRNPPHGHLALLRIQGPDALAVEVRARELAAVITGLLSRITSQEGPEADGRPPVELLPPAPAPIERINRRARWQMLLRARRRPPLRWLLGAIQPLLGAAGHGAKRTEVRVDVDPQSLM